MTNKIDLSSLELSQDALNAFLKKLAEMIKEETLSTNQITVQQTVNNVIDLLVREASDDQLDSTLVNQLNKLKTDRDFIQKWDEIQRTIANGDQVLFENNELSPSQILEKTNFPEINNLHDWSDYISGSGTTVGGWATGSISGYLSTASSTLEAKLSNRLNPVKVARIYKGRKRYHSLDLGFETSGTLKQRVNAAMQADADLQLSARSKGKQIANRRLGVVATAMQGGQAAFGVAQGTVDLVSGIQRGNELRATAGAIGIAKGAVDIGDMVAKKFSPAYEAASAARLAGTAADTTKKAARAAHIVPVVGGLLGIAASATSIAKNAMAADEAFDSGNSARGAMFASMAALDSIAI